jgi:surface protein
MILTDSQQKSNWIRFILTAIVFFTVSMFAFGFSISKSKTFKCENNIKHEENANNAIIHLDQTTPYTLIYDTRVSDPTDLTIEISLGGLSPNVTVDWGDGSPLESFTTPGFKPHTYATDGIYTVQISGSLSAPKGYDNTPHLEELIEIVDWGDMGWTSFHSIGAWAENLVAVPNSIPSSVTDLSHCFYFAKVFNQNISSWDVSNVTNMRSMFNGAFVFNQPLNSWDVSTVTDMGGMFMNTNAFNQPLNSWDVGDVTNMSNMFSFNANFNQNINNWDVGNVTHMSAMFYVAGVFNQPLDNWDVDNVTDMRWMFRSTGVFDQDISNWNVSNVSDMSWMFHNSRAFDQNIGSWDMSSVTNVAEMFSNSALSTSNYDQILIGWSSQNLNQNLTFYSSASYSCTAAAARQQIINNYGWTINDVGLSDNVPPTAIAQNIA